jgi:vitamin B12 transporter
VSPAASMLLVLTLLAAPGPSSGAALPISHSFEATTSSGVASTPDEHATPNDGSTAPADEKGPGGATRPETSPSQPNEPNTREGTLVFYETTTVTARPVSSASGSVSVIDAEDLAASQARSGGEVLNEVPGLNLLPTAGRAGVTHAWIRGADPNFTLVLLDGIPMNDPTDRQGGAFNLEELPAGLVERAEVVRGPQTSFYGMSSLSGVVQLFTPRGGPGPVRASLGAEAGNARLRRGFARLSGPAGRGGWSAGLSYDEERFRVARDRFRQIDAWAGADLVLGAGTDLSLTARFANGEQDDYPNSSGGPIYGTGELRHTEHDDLALGARLTLKDPGGRPHMLSAGLSRRAQSRLSPAVPPMVPESDEQTTFTRLRLAWQVPVLRAGRIQIDVGASGEGEWATNASLLRLPPALGGDVSGDYDEARASGGVFGALRLNRGTFVYEVALRVDAASGLSPQLNPQVGFVWSPGAGTTRLRASGGRATKLPSFFALSSPPALGGNPDLKPERTLGGEVGLEHDFRSARLDVGASGFLNEYRDLIDFDFDRFLHVNRARVRTRGVEITARWRPHETLRLSAEATYLNAKDLSGEPLLYEPRWLGGGSLTWEPTPRLRLRADVRAVSPYLDHQIPVPDRDGVPGYGIFGLAGSWRVHRSWSVRARLDNLADRSYETLIGFPGPARSFWIGLGWEHP